MKKLLSILFASILCLSLAACSGPTVATYLSTINVGVQAIIAIEAPSWPGATLLNQDFAAAEKAASTWQSGTPGTEAIEVLNNLAANLDNIPLGTKNDELIAAAINAVDNLVALIQSESKTASEGSPMPVCQPGHNCDDNMKAIYDGWLTETVNTPRKHVYTGKPIKSERQFKKVWNKTAPKPAKLNQSVTEKVTSKL